MQGSLADRLRLLRAERGLTLKDAGALLGVDRHTLRRVELGVQEPLYPTLKKIADGYGVAVEDLMEADSPLAEAPPSPSEASGERRIREAIRAEEERVREEGRKLAVDVYREVLLPQITGFATYWELVAAKGVVPKHRTDDMVTDWNVTFIAVHRARMCLQARGVPYGEVERADLEVLPALQRFYKVTEAVFEVAAVTQDQNDIRQAKEKRDAALKQDARLEDLVEGVG
jgi:transcriptional regulator with XRE-family HTH domain